MSHDEEPHASTKHKLKLKGVIGRGAFGAVHKGVLDGEMVAVKTMSRAGSGAQNARMFFREAKTLEACSHRRIIGYRSLLKMSSTDAKSAEPVWALVMEYAQNGNVTQRVVRQMTAPTTKQYSSTQALSWALDVAQALEYLHLRSPAVLHRDVKSANIMLTKEEGSLVAKLSDFGLHVIADNARYTIAQQRTSFAGGEASSSSIAALRGGARGSSEQQQGTGGVGRAAGSSSGGGGGGGGATRDAGQQLPAQQQQQQQQQPFSPTGLMSPSAEQSHKEDDIYSEVHDSGGSRVFVDTGPQQLQQLSFGDSSSGSATQRRPPARRNSSFRRAAHHPTAEALPRVREVTSPDAEKRPGLGMEAASAVNANLFAQWQSDGASTGSSIISMATDGTWVTDGTALSGTDTAGSDCTEDTCGGSILEEMETVFDMTGNTGSCLYMAPEVHLNKSYNEKSDVFSFGVVLYELMARTLVVFTELPQNVADQEAPQKYAAKVAAGYRPARPKSMPDDVWALITTCWQQDPVLRPHMSEVVAVLTRILANAQQAPRKPSFGLGKRPPSGSQPQPPANAAGAAAAAPGAAAAAAAGAVSSPRSGGSSVSTAGGDGATARGAASRQQQQQGQIGGGSASAPPQASQGCGGCVIC